MVWTVELFSLEFIDQRRYLAILGDPRNSAITVLAGVEPILTAPSSTNQAVGGNWNFGNLDIVAAGP